MTTNPAGLTRLDHLLTLEEWDALPETEFRCELVEGVPTMVAAPLLGHQRLVGRLYRLLTETLPTDREAVVGVEVLVDTGRYPTIRVPDLIVVDAGLPDRIPHLTGAEVRLVVEVLSPGTRRVDRVAKLHDYAEAGIPFYVIADPTVPPHATVFALRDGTYAVVDEGAAVTADGLRLDLAATQ